MKLKIFFCQFPNPWALRVSGMGCYTSKCEKKSKSLHPILHIHYGTLSIYVLCDAYCVWQGKFSDTAWLGRNSARICTCWFGADGDPRGIHTVIRFVWVSAKFGTCTVVSVNGTLVEAKMFTFTLESTQFIFNKCPIYTHDGASAKFSTNSHGTVDTYT